MSEFEDMWIENNRLKADLAQANAALVVARAMVDCGNAGHSDGCTNDDSCRRCLATFIEEMEVDIADLYKTVEAREALAKMEEKP